MTEKICNYLFGNDLKKKMIVRVLRTVGKKCASKTLSGDSRKFSKHLNLLGFLKFENHLPPCLDFHEKCEKIIIFARVVKGCRRKNYLSGGARSSRSLPDITLQRKALNATSSSD